MKSLLLVFFLIANVFVYAQISPDANANSFAELKQSFLSPSQHYGSAPLWVWNTNIDSSSVKTMLEQFKANAFGGVFVHPRAGLITPYLSAQWLNMYKYTVDVAKKLGLDVWIYDENSYPSGFAGGLVPSEMPSSYNEGEMLELQKDSVLPSNARDFFICLKKENGSFENITATVDEEKNKLGDYYLFKKTFYYQSPWYGGFSYVDLMKKGVTEKFLDVTMKPYERVIGNEFGKTVLGVFSDEPNIEVQYPNNIRWTPALFDAFFKKWNYRLEENLPSLFEEIGDWKKVRHNYYQTLLTLFINGWSKPFSSYTKEKKLEWTGHYWEHEWPSPNHGPDNMAMYAYPQRPGIDMLFNQFNEDDVNAQFGNIRSVKELSSVANQLNKKRVLSETYGGGGWELSFTDMKRLGDWEFVLGINTLNQHLSFMSIEGAR
ncbi:MAG: glycosyl hydrolase, partial [Bacteroidota bacterium]